MGMLHSSFLNLDPLLASLNVQPRDEILIMFGTVENMAVARSIQEDWLPCLLNTHPTEIAASPVKTFCNQQISPSVTS